MKLVIETPIKHSGKRLRPGDQTTVDDKTGKAWLDRGYAITAAEAAERAAEQEAASNGGGGAEKSDQPDLLKPPPAAPSEPGRA
jgi:hypothetical protein